MKVMIWTDFHLCFIFYSISYVINNIDILIIGIASIFVTGVYPYKF